MKLTFGILLTVVTVTLAQNEPHVTEGLLSAQADLSLGHQFFETALYMNRDDISTYMNRINHEIVTSHTEAYGNIKIRSLETIDEIDAIEVNERNDQCLQGVRDRFNLQVTRYVHEFVNLRQLSSSFVLASGTDYQIASPYRSTCWAHGIASSTTFTPTVKKLLIK